MSETNEEKKEFTCDICNKTFSKNATCYNHKKHTHPNEFKPIKENERGRPIKTAVKPFNRDKHEIIQNPRKLMQDRSFPDLAKLLLRIIREDKRGKQIYDEIFNDVDNYDIDFQNFVQNNYPNKTAEEREFAEFLWRDKTFNTDMQNFFYILLENWRITLKLTEKFMKELIVIVGFFINNCERMTKKEIIDNLRENFKFDISKNEHLGLDFLEQLLTMLFGWKENYKLNERG